MVERKTGKDKRKNDPKSEDTIDWDNIKWGSFTAQHKQYLHQHPRSKLKTLETFANYILRHKNKFAARTEKRANFYINVILKRKK